MPENEPLYKLLTEFANIYDSIGETYRGRAYTVAAAQLAKLRIPFKDAVKVKGIGSGIGDKLKEFLTTGKSAELNSLKSSKKVIAVAELSKILGVGGRTAQEWYSLGATDITNVRRLVAVGKISPNKVQKYGIMYYDDLSQRMPREEVKMLSDKVITALLSAVMIKNTNYEVVGSYRRGLPTSGDIDIIVSTTPYDSDLLTKLITEMQKVPEFIDYLSLGMERTTFLMHGERVRQVDVLNLPESEYSAGILYFTGSWDFNEAMRSFAKSKGYKLSQHGLYKAGKLIELHSEKEYFDILGLKYLEPKDRKSGDSLARK